MSDNPFLLSNAQKEQTPSKNPFALSNIEAEQNDQLRTRLYNGAKADPAKAARADILAKESGLPSDVVMRNLQDVEFRRAVEQADATLKTSPKLAQALREQMFLAEQAHKDVPSLSQLEQQLAKRADRTVVGTFGDIGVTALKGAVGLPQAFVGLADIVTGGYAGAGLEAVGLRFGDAQKFLDQMYSPAQQRANEAVREAQGFLDTLGAMLANPSTIATTVGESAPQMLGGAAIGRGILAMAPKVAPWLAAAFGEGVMGAGATAEQVRSENADGLLSAKQVFASVMSGAGTALFGAAGGRAAQKLGLGDIDTVLVSRGVDEVSAKTLQRGFVARLASAGVSEGFFEEMPQSVQEQMWNNFATDKPLGEGVGKAAAQGLLVGLSMGTGFQAVSEAGTALQRRQLEREAAVTRALNDSQQLTEAMQSAAQVTLRENNPTTFQQLIDTMAKGADGEPQSVFIDAQVLMQLATPEQINELLPSVAGQLREAATTNSSVEVPVAEALTRLPGTPLEQVFLQNAKSSPDALSQLEAEEAGKKAQEFMQQEEQRILKQVEDAQVWQASSDKVKQTILDQLNATGRFTPSVNDAYATLQQQFFSVMAQRLGTTPEDLYKRYALKVRAQGQPGAQVLNANGQQMGQGAAVDADITQSPMNAEWDRFTYRGVTVDFEQGQSGIVVFDIVSGNKRSGEARKALQTLKQRFGRVNAEGVMEDSPEAIAFWQRMLDEGVVDTAVQTDGVRLANAVKFGYVDAAVLNQSPFDGTEVATTPLPEGTTEIEVDGVMRPALNSEGRPIHWSEEGIRNFWRWFGDSKVVDAEGRPLVVYHGTKASFDQFGGPDIAGWFSSDAKLASAYAEGAGGAPSQAPSVMPVYLSLPKPLRLRGDMNDVTKPADVFVRGQEVTLPEDFADTPRTMYRIINESAFVGEVKAAGYDGLAVREAGRNTYAAFDPTQIKSATGNSGAFDGTKAGILEQSALTAQTNQLVREIEAAGSAVVDTAQVDQLIDSKDIPTITLQDMVGMSIFPTIADRTAAAALYTGIDSSRLDVAIPLLGGPFFPLRESNVQAGVAWANRGDGVIAQKAAKLKEGANYMLVVMGDANMHQSNSTVAAAFMGTLEAWARDGRITAEQVTALGDLVRETGALAVDNFKVKLAEAEAAMAAATDKKSLDAAKKARTQAQKNLTLNTYLENFPGFDDVSLSHTYVDGISFDARKRIMEIMASKQALALGAPPMQRILDATREPSLAGHRWGDGVLLVEVDQTNPQVELGTEGTTPHPDFPVGVRGRVVGKLNAPVSWELLWQDWLRENDEKDSPRRAFELAKPIVTVTQELVDRIGPITQANIDGARQARLAADFAAGNWRTSDDPTTKGGVSPQGFLDALMLSDAKDTLTQYTLADIKAGLKDGTKKIYQLGDGQIYFMLETRPDGSKYLASVVNNERGARGIGAPAVVLKAIEEGATDLDCFAVTSNKFPEGFLPSLYAAFGFEVTERFAFDSQYFQPQLPEAERRLALADAIKYWRDSTPGFDPQQGMPDAVTMRWKGTDDERRGITERYLRSGIEGLLSGGTDSDVRALSAEFSDAGQTPAGEGRPAPVGGRADGNQGAGAGSSIASRARGTVQSLAFLADQELANLNITADDRAAVQRALGIPARADTLEQSAYHGTPHRGIDKFSTDKIGTGEGAQAYGWGLYFASKRDIAEYYRETLSRGKDPLVGGKPFDKLDPSHQAATALFYNLGNVDAALITLNGMAKNADPAMQKVLHKAEKLVDVGSSRESLPKVEEQQGQLYEVDIPEDSEMLLWDKPLSEQPEGVRQALEPFTGPAEKLKWSSGSNGDYKYFNSADKRYSIADRASGATLQYRTDSGTTTAVGDFKNAAAAKRAAQEHADNVVANLAGADFYKKLTREQGSDKAASEYLASLGIKGIKYLDGTSRGAGDGSYNYVVFSGDDVAIKNQFYQGTQQARGTFKPKDLLITFNENANLSTFLHESGHFFLEVMADLAARPNAPQSLRDDWAAVMKWAGFTQEDWANWQATFAQTGQIDPKMRDVHEKFAQGFEAYLFEGKTSNPELQSVFRRFSEWLKRVYQSLTKFVGDNNIKLSEDVRMVMDRMLATEEQIRQAEEAAGLLPNFDATNEAIEQQTARSLRDMAYIARARGNIVKELQTHAADLRAAVEAEVRKEVEQQPLYAVMRWLRRGEMTQPDGTEIKAEKGFRLSTAALAEMYPESMLGRPALENLKGMTAKDGLHPDLVADMFGFQSGDQLVRAILDAEPIASVVEGMTDQRMLERYGELATQEAIEAAANDAIHNKARARILATEMKAQAEMLNGRTDTGRTASNGRAITVNSLMKAAKDFASALAGRRRIEDLKKATHLHRTAEARAGKAWQEATGKGDTQAAVQAKRDQVLNNAAVRALLDAQAEAKKIVEFFRKVTKGNNEKIVKGGRDPDVVNAMRAVLAAYGVAPRLEKSAQEYMEVVSKNDPAMYNALKPGVDAAVFNAKPLNMLTMDELRALNDELQAMWALAKRSRQSEIDGNLIDRQELEEGLVSRMQDIGVPDALGATGAPTKAELARQKLQHVGSLLRRVEQWAEGMDGAWGGPFLRYVFQPVKEAANRYRAARVDYRKRYQALVDKVAPFLTKGTIVAPELGNYEFGRGHRSIGHAELLHAILHTGNESNKRKLLLGRGWATENPDGSLDTSRWDSFIARMQAEGVLRKEHYDFAQGVWDLLEDTKPLAQKTHREVYGRYFDEVTANQVVTPFGTYRGGYVPAQVDTRIVSDNEIRKLAEAENENMAYSFPTANRGFTKSRTEYNRPLLLDLRTIGQHIDKVLLFSHMQSPINDVTRLLSSKEVSATLSRIDPTIYAGMLTPWLSRSVRQIVETPLIGDGGISRVLTAARSRAGMSLMFANVSNAIQQTTGFLTAMSKLKADGLQSHMMRATAQFIANPKKTAQAVADASEFMARRMENEIAALNDAMDAILLDPSLYEKAQAWTQKHAYFLQTALANTMEPIIWNAAYNAALEKGMSDTDAVRYADGLIRQTQGSTLPEDVSRIETGPAYARVFTQFIGYFNMMANTLATGLKQIAEEMGLKKGAGKALGIVTLGMLAPLWVAEAIALAMKGGPEDEDDDGYLDDWLAAVLGMGTIKGMFAMVPFVGQLANAGINRLNNNPADDRVSLSPAVSLLESAVGVPSHVYKAMTGDADKINARNAVRDVASAVSIATGLPAVAVARPLGYLAGMADDRIEPTGPVDFLRGMVTGTASPESKQR